MFQVALFWLIFQKNEAVFHFQKITVMKIFEVVFHLKKIRSSSISQKNWRFHPFSKQNEVVFYFQTNWGRLPFPKKFRSSSIPKKFRLSSVFKEIEVIFHFSKIEVVFHWKKIEVVFHFQKYWGRLPYFIHILLKEWTLEWSKHFTYILIFLNCIMCFRWMRNTWQL